MDMFISKNRKKYRDNLILKIIKKIYMLTLVGTYIVLYPAILVCKGPLKYRISENLVITSLRNIHFMPENNNPKAIQLTRKDRTKLLVLEMQEWMKGENKYWLSRLLLLLPFPIKAQTYTRLVDKEALKELGIDVKTKSHKKFLAYFRNLGYHINFSDIYSFRRIINCKWNLFFYMFEENEQIEFKIDKEMIQQYTSTN